MAISAVGTDGTSYAYAEMASATTFFGISVPLAGTANSSTMPLGGIVSLSSVGFFWDANVAEHAFLVPTGNGSVAVGA